MLKLMLYHISSLIAEEVSGSARNPAVSEHHQ